MPKTNFDAGEVKACIREDPPQGHHALALLVILPYMLVLLLMLRCYRYILKNKCVYSIDQYCLITFPNVQSGDHSKNPNAF